MRRATFFMLLALLLCARDADAGGLLSCTISASAVSFGTYNPLTPTPLDITGTLTYQCDFIVRLGAERAGARDRVCAGTRPAKCACRRVRGHHRRHHPFLMGQDSEIQRPGLGVLQGVSGVIRLRMGRRARGGWLVHEFPWFVARYYANT